MKNNPRPANPVLATILMALMSSTLCFIGVAVYLIINWNNQIWTDQVRSFFIGLSAVILVVTLGIIFLYRRIIR